MRFGVCNLLHNLCLQHHLQIIYVNATYALTALGQVQGLCVMVRWLLHLHSVVTLCKYFSKRSLYTNASYNIMHIHWFLHRSIVMHEFWGGLPVALCWKGCWVQTIVFTIPLTCKVHLKYPMRSVILQADFGICIMRFWVGNLLHDVAKGPE